MPFATQAVGLLLSSSWARPVPAVVSKRDTNSANAFRVFMRFSNLLNLVS